MIKAGSELVQAFPTSERTYVGVASGFSDGGMVLHAAEDGDITFEFGTSGTVVVSVVAGQDLALDVDIESITSTGVVWIS
jgi:hypothetical protein